MGGKNPTASAALQGALAGSWFGNMTARTRTRHSEMGFGCPKGQLNPLCRTCLWRAPVLHHSWGQSLCWAWGGALTLPECRIRRSGCITLSTKLGSMGPAPQGRRPRKTVTSACMDPWTVFPRHVRIPKQSENFPLHPALCETTAWGRDLQGVYFYWNTLIFTRACISFTMQWVRNTWTANEHLNSLTRSNIHEQISTDDHGNRRHLPTDATLLCVWWTTTCGTFG